MKIIPYLLLSYHSTEHCIVYSELRERHISESQVAANKCLESLQESSGFQDSNASSSSYECE